MSTSKRLAMMVGAICLIASCGDKGSIHQECRSDGTCKGRMVCRHVADSILDGPLYRCVPNDVGSSSQGNASSDEQMVLDTALSVAMTTAAAMICH